MTTKITFKHFHNGNDPHYVVRGSSVYATRARMVDLNTGDVIKETWAYCSPHDSPSRAKGREITQGRIEKELRLLKLAKEARAAAVEAFINRTEDDLSSAAHLL